ncbi:MAG: hypothetical protein Q8O90_05410 [Elusimicrobiota bacterium]|nr:hypothetical protein [Elusimicrobiota bacterium]
MRKFWLRLTDARLKAVLRALRDSGPCLGDLFENPASAPGFFRPLRAGLRRAASAASGSPPPLSQALAAAEDFIERLERVFSDLALHGTLPDAPVKEALLYLQRACGETPALLSPGDRAGAFARLRGFSAGARKVLALARAAAEASPSDFSRNLKFSSIYSGLDAAFDAYERCAEALFKI